jgi:thioredoxin-like negative regulator of GroEL
MTIALVTQLCLLGGEPDTYAAAHRVTTETGKPLMVMVSTEWCPPCQTMKKSVIPQVRQRGTLDKVAFAVVNPDNDRELAQQLTGGGPVPQLVIYRRGPFGWARRKLIGGQSVEGVERFINQAIADDAAERQAAKQKQDDDKHAATPQPEDPKT